MLPSGACLAEHQQHSWKFTTGAVGSCWLEDYPALLVPGAPSIDPATGRGRGEVHSDDVILTFDGSSAGSWRLSGEIPLEEVMIDAAHLETQALVQFPTIVYSNYYSIRSTCPKAHLLWILIESLFLINEGHEIRGVISPAPMGYIIYSHSLGRCLGLRGSR